MRDITFDPKRKSRGVGKVKRMTFDEYDELVERIKQNPYQCQDYWPPVNELQEKIAKEASVNIDFLIWLMETNKPPETNDEKASKSYINKLLRENLELYDPEEEEEEEEKDV